MIAIPKLTVAILLQIQFFCSSFIAEEPDCENEVIGCFLDDVYTVNQCKTEFLTDKYGVYDVELDKEKHF